MLDLEFIEAEVNSLFEDFINGDDFKKTMKGYESDIEEIAKVMKGLHLDLSAEELIEISNMADEKTKQEHSGFFEKILENDSPFGDLSPIERKLISEKITDKIIEEKRRVSEAAIRKIMGG